MDLNLFKKNIMPFNPKYTITDKIINNLTAIASAREVIGQACLSPALEEKLRRQALLHSARASTSLAGNKLSLKQVEALYKKKRAIKRKGLDKRLECS